MAVAVSKAALRMYDAAGEMIADLDSIQGMWTTEQYLRLTNHTKRLIEFTDGKLEVLPVPTDRHQSISRFLLFALVAFVHPRGGTVFYSALRMQIREDKFREPGLLLLLDADDPRRQNAYWLGADMVVEIVSPDDPARYIVEKRSDYAEAGVPEYWIVNPLDETIMVLLLAGAEYVEHGVYRRDDTAISALLAGFGVAVDDVFDAR